MTLPRRRATARTRLILVAALALAASTLGALGAPSSAAAWGAGAYSASSEAELVALTNRTRVAAGLPELEVDWRLTTLARWRSHDMIVRDYFSHEIPAGGATVFASMQDSGYCFDLAGENIGWNTFPDETSTDEIHAMLLASPGHRRNILGAAWEAIGVGAYKGPAGRKMWTVLFADRCDAAVGASVSWAGAAGVGGPAGATSGPPLAAPARRRDEGRRIVDALRAGISALLDGS